VGGVSDQNRAKRRARDDQQFGGLHQYQQVSLFDEIAAGNATQNYQNSNDWKHLNRFSSSPP
jgi:hypothetical protein